MRGGGGWGEGMRESISTRLDCNPINPINLVLASICKTMLQVRMQG